MKLGREYQHHDPVKPHNLDCDVAELVIREKQDSAAKIRLCRDEVRHPRLRAVLEEAYDGALAELNQLRSDLYTPLTLQAKALRERFYHERNVNLEGR